MRRNKSSITRGHGAYTCWSMHNLLLMGNAKAWFHHKLGDYGQRVSHLALPPSKKMKLRVDITAFVQYKQESLYGAWKRYKDLLWRCPRHKLPLGPVVLGSLHGAVCITSYLIDVGKLLFFQIKLSINNDNTALYFPMIIIELCA